MMPIRRISLLALAVLPFATNIAAAQSAIWRGQSGGFDITWSSADLAARRASDGVVVFSALRMANAEWANYQASSDDEVPVREFERKVQLLSVVGSIISLREENYCDCGGAHPISWTRFIAYDLARGTAARPQPATVAALVPETDLLRALSADPMIRQAMRNANVRTLPPLSGLGKALETGEIQPPGEECTYAVNEEFPTQFAVHHVENGRVALRFSASHSVEVCRGMFIQVGVLVPPRPAAQAAITAAAQRRAGFLMKDLRSIAGERVSRFDYHPRAKR